MSSTRQKPGYVAPFRESYSRPANYRDRDRKPVVSTLAEHDFYPDDCLKALDSLGVPRPEYRKPSK